MGVVKIKILPLLSAALFFAGCALHPSYRAHPGLQNRAKMIQTVVVLPPRVDVFHLDTGGVREKIDDWSTQAKKNLTAAIQAELQGRAGLLVKSPPEESMPEEVKSDLEETYTLFDTVNRTIILHTYSPPSPPNQLFAEKIENFEYSLGREVQALTTGEAGNLLLVRGVDHIWTEGRQALQLLGVILGIGAGVATGVVVIPVMGGGTGLSVALVDANTGSILWYNQEGRGGGYDLRDPASAAELVKELLKDFPLGKKEELAKEE